MRIIDCQQGTPEWLKARLGVITCSCLSQIVTPSTLKPSASWGRYLSRLCCEWFLGRPVDESSSEFMARGTEMEAEAVAAYEFENNVEARKVGFIVRDDGMFGGSPDRLVGDDGGLEIKCPSAEVHMGYVLNGIDAEYRCQVQGLLYLTGRKWWDLVAFNPALPTVKVRYEPDPAFFAVLDDLLPKFMARYLECKIKLAPAKSLRDEAIRKEIENSSDPF